MTDSIPCANNFFYKDENVHEAKKVNYCQIRQKYHDAAVRFEVNDFFNFKGTQ